MKKQKYEKPSITIVVLNAQQAVLSVCSKTGTSAQSTAASTKCKAAGCKKKNSTGDSAASC